MSEVKFSNTEEKIRKDSSNEAKRSNTSRFSEPDFSRFDGKKPDKNAKLKDPLKGLMIKPPTPPPLPKTKRVETMNLHLGGTGRGPFVLPPFETVLKERQEKLTRKTQSEGNMLSPREVASSEKPSENPPEKPKDPRSRVLAELIDTEQAYVSDINVCVDIYLNPSRKLKVLSDLDIPNIFSNIEVLGNLNKQVLEDFQKRRAASANFLVGDIFLKMGEYFKMYTSYCSNHDNALKTLERVKQDHLIYQFFDDRRSDPKARGLDVESFLIKPIQRLCKYPLLLRELIKHTPEDHPDYVNLIKAQTKIEEVVAYVNEGRRLAENFQKIAEIQESIESEEELNLISPSRRYIRETVLNVFTQNNPKPQKRVCFLFNDMLLYARQGRHSLLLGRTFSLNAVKFVDNANDTMGIKNAFTLIAKENNEPCTFSFATPEEKKHWATDIKQVVKEYQRKLVTQKKKEETLLLQKTQGESSPLSTSPTHSMFKSFPASATIPGSSLTMPRNMYQKKPRPFTHLSPEDDQTLLANMEATINALKAQRNLLQQRRKARNDKLNQNDEPVKASPMINESLLYELSGKVLEEALVAEPSQVEDTEEKFEKTTTEQPLTHSKGEEGVDTTEEIMELDETVSSEVARPLGSVETDEIAYTADESEEAEEAEDVDEAEEAAEIEEMAETAETAETAEIADSTRSPLTFSGEDISEKTPPNVAPQDITSTANASVISEIPKTASPASPGPVKWQRGSVVPSAAPTQEEKFRRAKNEKDTVKANIVKQLIESEEEYLDSLKTLITLFIKPLRENKILNEAAMSAIFSNVEIIEQLNTQILQELRTRYQENPKGIIGDIFLKMAKYFLTYITYCLNYKNSLKSLRSVLQENEHMIKLFSEHEKIENNLTCETLLSKPLLRLSQYLKTIKELIANTSNETDCEFLRRARGELKQIVTTINNSHNLADSIDHFLVVRNSIEGCKEAIQPGRRFLREIPVCVVKDGRARSRICFWFSDLLLFTKLLSDDPPKWIYKSSIALSQVQSVVPTSSEDNPHGVVLRIVGGRCDLSFSTSEAQHSFSSEIHKLVKKLHLNKNSFSQSAKIKKKGSSKLVKIDVSKPSVQTSNIPSRMKDPIATWLCGLVFWHSKTGEKLFANPPSNEEFVNFILKASYSPSIPSDLFEPRVTTLLRKSWSERTDERPATIEAFCDSLIVSKTRGNQKRAKSISECNTSHQSEPIKRFSIGIRKIS